MGNVSLCYSAPRPTHEEVLRAQDCLRVPSALRGLWYSSVLQDAVCRDLPGVLEKLFERSDVDRRVLLNVLDECTGMTALQLACRKKSTACALAILAWEPACVLEHNQHLVLRGRSDWSSSSTSSRGRSTSRSAVESRTRSNGSSRPPDDNSAPEDPLPDHDEDPTTLHEDENISTNDSTPQLHPGILGQRVNVNNGGGGGCALYWACRNHLPQVALELLDKVALWTSRITAPVEIDEGLELWFTEDNSDGPRHAGRVDVDHSARNDGDENGPRTALQWAEKHGMVDVVAKMRRRLSGVQ